MSLGQPSCQSSSPAPNHGTNCDGGALQGLLRVFSHSERRAQVSCSYFQPCRTETDPCAVSLCISWPTRGWRGISGSQCLAEGWDKPLLPARPHHGFSHPPKHAGKTEEENPESSWVHPSSPEHEVFWRHLMGFKELGSLPWHKRSPISCHDPCASSQGWFGGGSGPPAQSHV